MAYSSSQTHIDLHVQQLTESEDIADMLLRPPDDPSPTASRSDTSQPSDSSQATLHDQQPKPIRPLSLLSRFTNASGTGERRPVSSLPLGEEPCTPAALEDWVDDVYRSENPWHGQVRKKHVFSLGKPLPHIGSRQLSGRLERSDVESQEENPLHIDHVNLRSLESQNDTEILAESLRRPSGHRRTVNGVSHGGKYNDVGQPVFDYIPSDENACNHDAGKCNDGTIRGELEDIVKKPSYGIDSEPLGRRETDEVEKGNKDPDEVRNWWARIRARHPEPLAEFLATGVAVFLGLSATLSVNLTANQPVQYGTFEMTCWAWGFAWMLGIYLGGGISGAHMNPVISISLSIFRGFPWRSCAIYIAVQFLAALAAGALAWGIYKDTILSLDPTLDAMSRSFFSSPQAQVSVGTAFLNQVVGSAIMIIAIFALGDDQNNPPGAGMHAFVLGLLITMLRFSLGYTAGAALNPASDFGPRLVVYAVGYREYNVFRSMWWFYGPFLANMIGCIIGCSLYDGMIFVGSESPINYRVPEKIRKRTKKFLCGF